jgi:hypothetical protein
VAEMTGGCACGKVRYRVGIDADDAYLCHCRMCQRASGSVSIAFKNVRKDCLHWQGETDLYQSSPIAQRPTSHFGAESMHRAWINTEGLPSSGPTNISRWSIAG